MAQERDYDFLLEQPIKVLNEECISQFFSDFPRNANDTSVLKRLSNCMQAEGVPHIGMWLILPDEEILRTSNMGKKTLQLYKDIMEANGFNAKKMALNILPTSRHYCRQDNSGRRILEVICEYDELQAPSFLEQIKKLKEKSLSAEAQSIEQDPHQQASKANVSDYTIDITLDARSVRGVIKPEFLKQALGEQKTQQAMLQIAYGRAAILQIESEKAASQGVVPDPSDKMA